MRARSCLSEPKTAAAAAGDTFVEHRPATVKLAVEMKRLRQKDTFGAARNEDPATASWIAGVFKFESSQIIKPPEKLQFDPVAELEHCIGFVRFERAWLLQESKNSGP